MSEFGEEKREHFRVPVPEDMVIELAVWFRRRAEIHRLTLEELGEPHLVKGPNPALSPQLVNVSAEGLALSLRVSHTFDASKLQNTTILVYVKLIDPSDPVGGQVFFLLATHCVFARDEPGLVRLGLKIVREGRPEPYAKAVEFAECERYGIADWDKFCVDLDRWNVQADRHESQGLQLGRLMQEIAKLRAAKKETGKA